MRPAKSESMALAAALAAALLLLAHALRFRAVLHGNCVDDAYISFRYATHLARGQGLVFNPGERVEGYSNFLWTVLLAPLARASGDLTVPAQVLGLGCSLLTLLLLLHASRRAVRVELPVAAAAASMLLLCASGYFAVWSVAGLEGPLFGALLLAAWSRWIVEQRAGEGRTAGPRRPISALLFAALALTRTEGIFVALAACLFHVVHARRGGKGGREVWLFPALVAGVVLAYEAWRFGYYGPHLLPNSVHAKVGGGLAEARRGFAHLGRYFLAPYAPLLLAPALLGRGRRDLAFATGYVLFAGYLLFVALAGGDWSIGRFYSPVLPLGSLLFVTALVRASQRLRSPAARGVVAAVFLVYAGWTFLFTSRMREQPGWEKYSGGDVERIAIGKWLAREMPKQATVAVYAAGQIPYYSGLRAHDMLGLNDPHIAHLQVPTMGQGVPGHEKYDVEYTLRVVRPDIIVDGNLVPGMRRHPIYQSEYYPVQSFWKLSQVVVRRDLMQRMGAAPGAR